MSGVNIETKNERTRYQNNETISESKTYRQPALLALAYWSERSMAVALLLPPVKRRCIRAGVAIAVLMIVSASDLVDWGAVACCELDKPPNVILI